MTSKLPAAMIAAFLTAATVSAREPEPRAQDWEFHKWMAKVADTAQQKGYTIEDAELDFTEFWESTTTDAAEPTPEAALEHHRTAIAQLNKEDTDQQERFDKWWDELKAIAPAYGYQIEPEDDAQREYFWHHGFPEGQTPAQAIVAAQGADAKRHIKDAQHAVFVALETQAALAHGLTEEETTAFHDWARWQRDEVDTVVDAPPEPPHAMSGEQSFDAWKRDQEEQKDDCGP